MMVSTTKNKIIQSIKYPIAALFCLTVWDIGALIVSNNYFLPSVKETLAALLELIVSDGFFLLILNSLLRVAVGLTVGIVLGVILATLCTVFPISEAIISPIISIMKATPIATIVLILWFTFTDFSLAIFVVILMVTPIIWQNVYDGFKAVPTDLTEVCSAFEVSPAKKLTLLIIPSVLHYLIPAIITSIGLAWKAEIAAEIMTYSNIGRSIQDYKSLFYDTASVFAWAVVIITLSLILENLTKHFLRRIEI